MGDGTDLPTSKAGSVAHFQAEVLVDNIVRHIKVNIFPHTDFIGIGLVISISTPGQKAALDAFGYIRITRANVPRFSGLLNKVPQLYTF